jgi:hypothetical protein
MVDHISLGVGNLERLVRTLDFVRGSDWGSAAGQTGVEFTITIESATRPSPGMHLCLRATNHETVWAFYRAALENGGGDDGPPGLRPIYHPDYFAAFVIDPDGHRIEAVCHLPRRQPRRLSRLRLSGLKSAVSHETFVPPSGQHAALRERFETQLADSLARSGIRPRVADSAAP